MHRAPPSLPPSLPPSSGSGIQRGAAEMPAGGTALWLHAQTPSKGKIAAALQPVGNEQTNKKAPEKPTQLNPMLHPITLGDL